MNIFEYCGAEMTLKLFFHVETFEVQGLFSKGDLENKEDLCKV